MSPVVIFATGMPTTLDVIISENCVRCRKSTLDIYSTTVEDCSLQMPPCSAGVLVRRGPMGDVAACKLMAHFTENTVAF